MNAGGWLTVAGVLAFFLLLALSLLALAFDCNLRMRESVKAANAAAKRARLEATAAKQETARYAHTNKSLREHTAEHCAREAAMRTLLAANGIAVVEVSTDDLTDAKTPADIEWGPK
jgi:hypothetical protein